VLFLSSAELLDGLSAIQPQEHLVDSVKEPEAYEWLA